MTTPRLVIDVDKIEHNTRTIVELCNSNGIEVTGVTKVTCGHPQVAQAMLRGGVTALADSRLENIQRLTRAGVDTEFMLLRLPTLSRVDEAVDAVAVSMNSELAVLEALSEKVDQLVVGGGISGIQAALDMATAGFKVYLVEKGPSIGGHMAQLDKTFPTNDCST